MTKTRAVVAALVGEFLLGVFGCGGGPTTPATFRVGGRANGLTGSMVLQNNGGDDLTVPSDGTFTFATAISTGGAYNVTVKTPPSGQTCAVSFGQGVATSAVTSIDVTCTTTAATYTIGGSVTGLTGAGLALSLSTSGPTEDLNVAARAASYVFLTRVGDNRVYIVSVKTQPAGQTCNVANSQGTVPSANVTNANVSCL